MKCVAFALLMLIALPAHADPGSIAGTVLAPIAKHRQNTVVYVKTGPPAPTVAKVARMDQKGLVFTPRVLPIQRGSTVEFLNSDPVAHNVYTLDGEKYDLGTWPQGQIHRYVFKKSGIYRQLCKVHDDMIAYVLVLDTPWFAVSDKDGRFTLAGLPPGSYTLGIWHEKLAAPDLQVTVTSGQPAAVAVTLKAR
jgi:plastocyanin